MDSQPEFKLADFQVIPDFSYPSSLGVPVGLWTYKQRKNLVIFFFHDERCPGCRERLRQFAQSLDRFRELDTQVLAITTASQSEVTRLAQEEGLTFPVLSDPTASFMQRLVRYEASAGPPAVGLFVTDRFGALYTQKVGRSERDLPSVEEILDTIYYIEMQCPECGVGEWPMEGT